jgi:hypothetical protein
MNAFGHDNVHNTPFVNVRTRQAFDFEPMIPLRLRRILIEFDDRCLFS